MSAERPPRQTRRRLSTEERALWRAVARSVKPMPGVAIEAEPDEPVSLPPPPAAAPKARSAPPPSAPPPSAPPLAPLVRREKQRLARGTAAIEARLDLHGMTQAEAHSALAHFLRRAQADGAKFALVITGKGARGEGGRGVLRRLVPLWLRMPEFRELVVGFETAHATHGGEGAFYVRMRRRRA